MPSVRSLHLLLATTLTAVSLASAQVQRDPLTDSGIVERSGVALLLVDVEVESEDGSPLPGLKKDDFSVELNSRAWPIYSVDDFCPCTTSPGELAHAVTPTSPPPVAASTPEAERVKFILYLDFGQLQQSGRDFAIHEAKRWIGETMQPQDEVMVAAHAERAGLQILANFTTDKARLLAAVSASNGNVELVDSFPQSLPIRIRRCSDWCEKNHDRTCPMCWYEAVREEYRHSRDSFAGLRLLLERLQGVPGRKALVLFNENGALFPTRIYRGGVGYGTIDEDRISDQISLVDRVAAEATLARTSIYTVCLGGAENANLGANLAQFTGGGHSGPAHARELTTSAGRGCACMYRIGLTPPDDWKGRIFRLNVTVRGLKLENTYRVQHLSDGERWMRAARAVLADPEHAHDLPIVAAIVPVAGRKEGWDLELQVGMNAGALQLLPAGAKRKASWEVGSLLSGQGDRRSWEMLGVSQLLRQSDLPSATTILHTRTMQDVRPGSYELRAFVRDRFTNLYGGVLAAIELPAVGADGIAGPLVRRPAGQFVRTTLPLRTKEQAIAPGGTRVIETGSVPTRDHTVRRGEPLEFTSWTCPGEAKDTLYDAQRFISQGSEALLRFDDASITPAGDCVKLADRLDTSNFAAGAYTYHVRWQRAPGTEPVEVEASFEIEADTPIAE